ncbi:hypothetical protein RFI_08054 [Reticulomyxa filosa]|uniref:Oxidoreductase-like domain-containing protein n=1 Tax=Reticulomyxa filosa TaxID=46433 RepID=X6NSY8_RETFI|nr:hypothetical protein RFI_08054 [Reticulomyxa filosa]|eukprot:ETO29073.1 hypothetical protein RFI_08054 [Reticulomyxa filosa]
MLLAYPKPPPSLLRFRSHPSCTSVSVGNHCSTCKGLYVYLSSVLLYSSQHKIQIHLCQRSEREETWERERKGKKRESSDKSDFLTMSVSTFFLMLNVAFVAKGLQKKKIGTTSNNEWCQGQQKDYKKHLVKILFKIHPCLDESKTVNKEKETTQDQKFEDQRAIDEALNKTSMDAFTKLEMELSHKKAQPITNNDNPIDNTQVSFTFQTSLKTHTRFVPERPTEPLPEECCGMDCPNCVWTQYAQRLFEYEQYMKNNPKSST